MNLMELVAKISLDSSEYKSGLSGLGSAVGTMAGVATKAIAGASTAVMAFGASSVSAGMDFDSAMSQVGATMGFTIDELNDSTSEASKTMEQLRSFAQEMGASTAFSATQASEALNYMALAGYDAETSMAMLPNVLNLASAGGIELASASDMVTDAQTALGLSLEETSTMVDQMAMASSKSNTSVEQLGEAFLTIGANARGLAGGTQELSTMLGVLADNGIKGSEAGTHLRNIMLAMNPTTEKASNAWEALGVTAYDADGNLRPLQDTFGDLSKAMEGMNEQEKSMMLTDMFNKTDLASINALLGTTGERFDELSGYIGDAKGSAEEMAKVQLDNLAGDVTLFKSALEGVQIAVSNGVTPVLRKFVQIGSDGLGEIADKLGSGDIEGAFGALGEYLGMFLNQIVEMLPEVVSAGIRLIEALGQGIMDNLPTLIESATQILLMITTAIISNLPKLIEAGIQIILQLATAIAEALPDLMPTIVDVILTIVETLIDNVDLLIDSAIAIITAVADGLINSLPILIEKVPIIIEKLLQAFATNAPKIVKASFDLTMKLAEGLIQYFPNVVAKVPQLITALRDKFISLVKNFNDVGKHIVDALWEGIKSAWDWLKNSFSSLLSGLVDSLVGGLTGGGSGGSGDGGGGAGTRSLGTREPRYLTSLQTQPQNVYVTLEGDANRLFRIVQAESSRNVQLIGG